MAIKTKKISELGQIEVADIDILKKSDFYFLGCMGGVTGKVSTSDVVNAIRANVEATSRDTIQSYANTRQSTDLSKVEERITNLEINLKKERENVEKLKNLNKELSEKVTAIESFLKALQKDGYLTLAEIRKAAADACPICNHTHEEETTTEG